jgi:hypothetical protein
LATGHGGGQKAGLVITTSYANTPVGNMVAMIDAVKEFNARR